MLEVLGVTTPIYLLVGAGYVAVWRGWMTPADLRVLGRFVVSFCIPALLFRALTRQPIEQVLNGRFLIGYAAGSLLSFTLVASFARQVLGRERSLAVLQGLGVAGSNSAFIGYPIVLQLVGSSAAVALALCSLVENLLMLPLALGLAQARAGGAGTAQMLRATLLGLARNPMILGIAAGLVFSALELRLPGVFESTLAMAAAAGPPTALFVVGGSLVGLSVAGIRTDIALVTAGKLLLHPLCVLLGVWWLLADNQVLRSAAVLFAAMPMLSIYPVLAQRFGHERFCAAALLSAMVVSFVTISVLIALLPPSWVPLR